MANTLIDPLVSLAFAVYSNKGAYALLLGSGVSRSAAIPTGWEVLLDLVRKVAKLEGEDADPDPEAWFVKKHGCAPEYSKLLDAIAKTSTERQRLLKSYFEPSEEDRAQGLKAPTPAHRAIAQLAKDGYLRVILTTNFDRLMESAMEGLGLTPVVISTADQIAGALPLAHAGVTIIKLHGDYLDTRIKNTAKELATYSSKLTALLDRIFDEYGLIICGWSAEWDMALRDAIERCVSRRFTTYWTTRRPLVGNAKRLAELRRAEVIKISDANHFFTSLAEKVHALDDTSPSHPLSAKLAAATLKRYLPDPGARIRLHDLVHDETERLVAQLTNSAFPAETNLAAAEEVQRRVTRYDALTETLRSILITGCYWGDRVQIPIWVACLQRVANANDPTSGFTYLLALRRYPALVLLYAAGLAAVAAGRYDTLTALLIEPQVRDDNYKRRPICSEIFPDGVMKQDIGWVLAGMNRHFTPVSEHLFALFRDPMREYKPGKDDYERTFDRFEYLLGLVHADIKRRVYDNDKLIGPVGCFAWRGRHSLGQSGIRKEIQEELDAAAANWPPIKAGLFGGSFERAKDVKNKFDAFVASLQFFL
jgi:hypothetical protein